MKTRFNILAVFFLIVCITACNNFGNDQNPLRGIIYKDISEVPQFKNYEVVGGDIMTADENSRDEFVIMHITDSIRNVVIFGNLLKDHIDRYSHKIQILDTINFEMGMDNEHLVYSLCRPNATSDFDPKIIAVVAENGEEEFTDRIVRAWRIDIETMKIRPTTDTKGINCINVNE